MLLEKVHHEKGWDFRSYKKTSLKRRVSKRLVALGLGWHPSGAAAVADYLELLDRNPSEYATLFSTLTVKMSEFFRDPEDLDLVRRAVLEMPASDGLRAWSCGCAYGEEAFSLAMMLCECLGEEAASGVKVFATDIDGQAVERARRGVFKADSLSGMPEDLAGKYLFPFGDELKVKYSIRNMVRFGVLDIVRDTPISRIDVLLFRNIFIYFDKALQQRVFSKLDWAVRPGGVLVLGKAETIPPMYSGGYERLQKGLNVYRKRSA